MEECFTCVAKPVDWPSIWFWTVVGVKWAILLLGNCICRSIDMHNTPWMWSMLPRPLGSIALGLLLLTKLQSGWFDWAFPPKGGPKIKVWGIDLQMYIYILLTVLAYRPKWRMITIQEQEEEAAGAAAAAVNTDVQDQLAVEEVSHVAGDIKVDGS